MSLPVRGAWIEIPNIKTLATRSASLPVRGAWIEIVLPASGSPPNTSLPVRGAWIEIFFPAFVFLHTPVAPCEGSVD